MSLNNNYNNYVNQILWTIYEFLTFKSVSSLTVHVFNLSLEIPVVV